MIRKHLNHYLTHLSKKRAILAFPLLTALFLILTQNKPRPVFCYYHIQTVFKNNFPFNFFSQTINRFPKHQRFLIGDKMQTATTLILELLIEAYYLPTTEKKAKLQQVNIELEKMRFFIRLCYDLGYYASNRYKLLAEKIDELGRMTGGWLRALDKK